MTDLRFYENFLEYRRNGNNWSWTSRELNHQLAFKQSEFRKPEYHKDAVLKSPKIQDLLDQVSVHKKCRTKFDAINSPFLQFLIIYL